MFTKILIANRGEIALRIIRACRQMGIQTVAVYSTADKDALHVALADEAVCIGPSKSSESYLNRFAILSAAVATGCQAIHPGFGFLSENAEFARMCHEHQLVFIGPHPDVIDRMGNKSNAREAMQQAGVPVIPGSSSYLTSVNEAVTCANELGYPVLLKAVAGGGGKGMRKVFTPEEMQSAFLTTQSEAKAAFGDDRIYMEKIISPARHIEVQILADHFGHCIHLGERECSLQRRHQKVIEESPSSFVDEALRQKMGDIAVKAAQFVNYTNAGTIEFLVDDNKQCYFMEMNTRIQVEHPVTEMVTGIDLIQWQIKIANDQALTIAQKDVQLKGHAIECRINAEDPSNDFMASCGKVSFVHFPSGNGVRIDSAVYSGYTIPPFYDAMIAKIIVHDHTRQQAIAKMESALHELSLTGITHNGSFQQQLLQDDGFRKGQFHTEYLQNEFLKTFNITSVE